MKFTATLSLLFATPTLIDAFIQNSPIKTSMGVFSTMPGGPEYRDSALVRLGFRKLFFQGETFLTTIIQI